MNWIEDIDDMLADIECTVKGREGDTITKVRGIIDEEFRGKAVHKVLCTGCGRDKKNKLPDGYLACCPDSRYRDHFCVELATHQTIEK